MVDGYTCPPMCQICFKAGLKPAKKKQRNLDLMERTSSHGNSKRYQWHTFHDSSEKKYMIFASISVLFMIQIIFS
jgi:hypothetical protein